MKSLHLILSVIQLLGLVATVLGLLVGFGDVAGFGMLAFFVLGMLRLLFAGLSDSFNSYYQPD